MKEKVPSKNEIKNQLQLILESKAFKRSPKITRFLEYLVDESLQDRKKYIKAYSIAITVFDKDDSFDPQSDPLVRVSAVRLRRMLREYYFEAGNKDNIIVDLVRGSYIPKFSYREFIDDENLQEIEIVKESSFPSIAVLNFNNKSSDDRYNYLVDGIAQEIIMQLSKIKEIVVIGRSAVDLDEDIYKSTKRLRQLVDVRYVLTGNVFISENHIRIYVELDDISNYTNLWTNLYENKIDKNNVILIENDVATHVATAIAEPYGIILRKELAKLNRVETENLSAYQLYLQFYQFSLTLSQKDHLKARDALEKSVEIDPTFSAAWAALSLIYAAEFQFSFNRLNRNKDVRDLSIEAARKAIKIDPENSRASYSLVFAKMTKEGMKNCAKDAEKAYKANSNNSLLVAIHGSRLALSGNWDRGLELIEEAMELNLSHPDSYYLPFALNYYRQGQVTKALAIAQKMDLPDFFFSHIINAALHADMEQLDEATADIKKLKVLYPDIENCILDELKKWEMQTDLILKFKESLHHAGLKFS